MLRATRRRPDPGPVVVSQIEGPAADGSARKELVEDAGSQRDGFVYA